MALCICMELELSCYMLRPTSHYTKTCNGNCALRFDAGHVNVSKKGCPSSAKEQSESLSWMRCYIWVFPKIGVPQNGWFIMEKPIKSIKMDGFGGPTPIF